MIASEDVRRVTFEHAMRGYRCEDVDDYLKQVADVMDALSEENDDLQNKIRILGQRIDQYRSEEDTLRTTMINAQRMGENVIKEAKQKAAETIRAANIKADDREQRARDEVELAQQEIVTLKRESNAFKKMLLDKYREHIELLSKIPEYTESTEANDAAEMFKSVAPEQEENVQTNTSVAYTDAEAIDQVKAPETKPEPEAPAKVDTVEFAIAPRTDATGEISIQGIQQEEPTVVPPASSRRERQVNALFGEGNGAYDKAPAKSAPRSKSRTSKAKTKEPKVEDLPAAFDSFEGVDFES